MAINRNSGKGSKGSKGGHFYFPTFDFGGGGRDDGRDGCLGFGAGAGMAATGTYASVSGAPSSGWAPSNSWAATLSPPDPWPAYLCRENVDDNDADTDEDDGEDLDGSDFPGTIGQDDDAIQQYL